MNRTVALLFLLLIVAGAAIGLRVISGKSSSVPVSVVDPQPDDVANTIAKLQHARVDDATGILAPFGVKLGRMADAFYDDLGIDVQVVTRNDAQPSIEEQADQLFQQKRIGVGAPTGGLLVVLNPQLARARIEVGYTLEGGLTDLHTGRIARDQLAPYTSYAIAGMAVMDVLHYLRDQVYVSAALGNIALNENFRNKPAYLEFEKFTSGGAGARTKLSAVPIDADLKRTVPQGVRARYAPSANVEESVAAFLRATADLAGDPTLELFTEGSRLMRAHYPVARFEELLRLERIQSSLPLEYLRQGEYVVATSRRPVNGFVPILLHREVDLWRVDLVETWKNLFFDSTGNYVLRNSNTPYGFGLTQFGAGRHYDVAAIPLEGRTVADALAALEGKEDAVSALRRAEIWLRNAFVFPAAFSAYEAARRAAPDDPLVLQTLGDRAMYLAFPELAIPALSKIGPGVELSLAEAYNDLGYAETAWSWVERALEENPYDLHALRWQQFIAEREDRADDLKRSGNMIARLSRDPERSANPVLLIFHPPSPRYEPDTTRDVDGTTVFDHSDFSVTMRNTSNRSVEIESVTLTSMGTAAASGLGDIKGYWRFPAGHSRLPAGASVSFGKVWGFTVETGHQHVRYVFRTCWHGVGSTVRQCRTQWVDAMP